MVLIVLHTGAVPWSAWPLRDLFEAEPTLGWVPDGLEAIVLSLDEQSEQQLLEERRALLAKLVGKKYPRRKKAMIEARLAKLDDERLEIVTDRIVAILDWDSFWAEL